VDLKRYCERTVRRLAGTRGCSTFCWRLSPARKASGVKKGHFAQYFSGWRPNGQSRKALDKAGFKTDLSTDEEHGLWEVEVATTSGVNVSIDWNFASYVEFQRAVELYMTLETSWRHRLSPGQMGPAKRFQPRGFARESAGGGEEGSIDSTLQRSGRVNPEQLWKRP